MSAVAGITDVAAVVPAAMRATRRGSLMVALAACATGTRPAPVAIRAPTPAETPQAEETQPTPHRPRCDAAPSPFLHARAGSLTRWFEAARGPRAVWLLLGDSHVEDGALAATLRTRLQSRLGDGGAGLLPPATVRHYGAHGASPADLGWEVRRGLASDDVGITGLRLRADGDASLALTLPRGTTRLGVLHRTQDGAGIAANGVALTDGSIDVRGLPQVTLRRTGSGTVRVDALAADAGDGAVVDAAGVVGARLTHRARWDLDAFDAALRWRRPAMVALMYGTNDAADPRFDLQRFIAAMEVVTARARAHGASVLWIGAPDFALRVRGEDRYVAPAALDAVVAAQREVAAREGVGFFDTRAWMGGAGAVDALVRESPPRAWPDHVHLTPHGYRALGAALDDAVEALRRCAEPAGP